MAPRRRRASAGLLRRTAGPATIEPQQRATGETSVMARTTSSKRSAAAAAKSAKAEIETGAEDVASEARRAGTRAKRQASVLEETLTRSAEDIAATVSERLRAVGVDTDRMADVAKEQASELQKLIEDEIRERPLRALGLAAAVGLFVGYLSAR